MFPLHTVLFPGGVLPLRVFEARYLDMVSECMRSDTGFGICLIRRGREVGGVALPYEVGTLARIVDWGRGAGGLLGITARGERRFRITDTHVHPNRLMVARVEWLPAEPAHPLPRCYQPLADLLRRIVGEVGERYVPQPMRFDDAGWVGCRLVELLPLRLPQKQYFLQMDDPLQRLERLYSVLDGLEML